MSKFELTSYIFVYLINISSLFEEHVEEILLKHCKLHIIVNKY